MFVHWHPGRRSCHLCQSILNALQGGPAVISIGQLLSKHLASLMTSWIQKFKTLRFLKLGQYAKACFVPQTAFHMCSTTCPDCNAAALATLSCAKCCLQAHSDGQTVIKSGLHASTLEGS